MSKFDDYYNKFMGMHKARIIVEGQFQNIWADTEGTTKELMKWNKVLLARTLADRMRGGSFGATKPQLHGGL